jgi:hypothetical protein
MQKILKTISAVFFAGIIIFFGVNVSPAGAQTGAPAASTGLSQEMVSKIMAQMQLIQQQIMILQQQLVLVMRQTGKTKSFCSDGTVSGRCSVNQPYYCDNGALVAKCSLCGCSEVEGGACSSGGTCQGVSSCSDGTIEGHCSSAKPMFCMGGDLVWMCDRCGCPSGFTCGSYGTCQSSEVVLTTVVFPNGGNDLFAGSKYTIKWSTSGLNSKDSVQISLRDTRYPSELAEGEMVIANTTNTGSYVWTIPDTLGGNILNGPQYKIAIYVSGGGAGKFDLSDNGFSITPQTSPCSDGTLEGKCSSTKPMFCMDSTLVWMCDRCGCPSGKTCGNYGVCQ